MYRILCFAFLLLGFTNCNPKAQLSTIRVTDLSSFPKMIEPDDYKRPCAVPENYSPDEWTERRVIRVNVHLLNNTAGTANFSHDVGKDYVQRILWNCNERLGKNVKMNLPVGNDTPVLDPHYRYRVVGLTPEDDGFYTHIDDEHSFFMNKGKNRNNYDKEVIKKYKIRSDSILNIFVISHPQDSLGSKSYKAFGTGIALGTSLKVAGLYTHRDKEPYTFGSLMNHEIAHVLGLGHAWTKYDGCDDTPVHPNCWDADSPTPCDGTFSNNMMDYNYLQSALTPCQLGKIHKNFSTLEGKTRKLIYDAWCNPILDDPIYIDRHVAWKGSRDLRRDIVILPGGQLDIHCRISMAAGRKITVKNGGSLHLHKYAKIHNDCGDTWEGIEVEVFNDINNQLLVYENASINNINYTKNPTQP